VQRIQVKQIEETTIIPVDIVCHHPETQTGWIETISWIEDENVDELWEICTRCNEPQHRVE
jgi:hypothetical protein